MLRGSADIAASPPILPNAVTHVLPAQYRVVAGLIGEHHVGNRRFRCRTEFRQPIDYLDYDSPPLEPVTVGVTIHGFIVRDGLTQNIVENRKRIAGRAESIP